MIPFDFDYYRPDSVKEAVKLFRELDSQGKQPVYYGGGTEIISMSRVNNFFTKAVIDLKGIQECNVLDFQADNLTIGSSVTLSSISESKLFPLLAKAVGRIADHTIQGKITLGGNLGGTIIYKEAVLPLLLSDCHAVIAGPGGRKKAALNKIFDQKLQLEKGEFIVSFGVDRIYLSLPYVHVKKTKSEKIDYPLVTVSALKKDSGIRIALSGVCPFPFRSLGMEDALNNRRIPAQQRIDNALKHLPAPILNDISGTSKYREFVLRNTLMNTVETLEEVQ